MPAGTATYFIGNDGQPTALLHTPVACSPSDARCEAESSDAAERDLQVALWLAGRRWGGPATRGALQEQETARKASRDSACTQPAGGEFRGGVPDAADRGPD